jgi:hypothetical protein
VARSLKSALCCSLSETRECSTDCIYLLDINFKWMEAIFVFLSALLIRVSCLCGGRMKNTQCRTWWNPVCFFCVHQRPHSGQRSIYFMINYYKLSLQRIFPLLENNRAFIFLSLEIRQWFRERLCLDKRIF